MKFFKTIRQLLDKPFPERENKLVFLRNAVAISVFVTFFLFIYQPFGIADLPSDKFFVCLGFGAATLLAILFYELIVGSVLYFSGQGPQWTFGKWTLYHLGVMLVISLTNFLFARWYIFGYIQWELLPYMIYSTFTIGIIPITVLGWISMTRQERKYLGIAAQIDRTPPDAAADDQPDERLLFGIPIRRIRYVEALQNYAGIGYVNAAGHFQKATERASLKQILEVAAGSPLVQSHRSFLVNRRAIVSVSGNAQGLVLELSDSDRTVPVSRSYVPVFRGE